MARLRWRLLTLTCSLVTIALVIPHGPRLLAAPVTEVIVKTGDRAPDDDGTFNVVTMAALNNCGWAAFVGSLSGTNNFGARAYGEFLADGTTRTQVARTNDPAPGGPSTDFFHSFSNVPALNDAGQVLFEAASRLNNQTANCLFTSNPLTRLFDGLGQPAPGGNGTVFELGPTHEWPAFNQKGIAAFVAALTGTSNGTSDDTAIYRTSSPGQLTEIVREGKAPPEGNGVFDQMLGPGPMYPILNESGQVAFRAALRGTSGGLTDNQGIYRGDGRTLIKIARSGPTQPLPEGGTIHSFGVPSACDMNDSGKVVFPVDLDGNSAAEAIYEGSGGALTKIARFGDTIPNTADTFAGFNVLSRINNKGQVAFNAVGAHINPNTSYWGIFLRDGANIVTIVREGQTTPGRAGVFTSLGTDGTLNYRSSGFCLNSSGQVAFRGGISANNVSEYGIYFFDGTQLQQVARTNDTFVWPDNRSGTITDLQFAGTNGINGVAPAERSGLNDAGQVVFGLTTRFTDNTSRYGIAIWSPTLKLLCAHSTKTQGGKNFDVDLPLTSKLGVECRSGGAQGNYTLVLRFTNKLLSVGSASVTTGVGSVSGTPIINGNTMTVNLTGVANAQKIIVTITNVADASRILAKATVPMGILLGDVDGNKTVDTKDVNAVNSKVGTNVSKATFRDDANVSGTIDQTDVDITQGQVGTSIP